ncbi:velvet factor-domain-containing protein [Amanita rubescens]|nr:velvet factor-domain-containing protein [Amanita rubescens]
MPRNPVPGTPDASPHAARMTRPSTGPSSARNHSQIRDNTSFINRPIHYGSGQFRGRIIRIELDEVQKADLGRKYARVDRRPLDPPPVVQMRIYEVLNAGSERETEREVPAYDSIEVLGFVCTVDLFPVSRLTKERRKTQNQPFLSPAAPHSMQHFSHPPGTVPPPQYISSSAARSETETLSSSHPSPHEHEPPEHPTNVDSSDVVHHVDGYALSEKSKMTSALVGATFVQPVALDYQGRRSLMFVFADLAVKTEGHFILRYRVFDIFSTPIDHTDRVIQAECYGGVFRVYSTKEFPGLPASTELTKQLARWGVRLNIREAERKRRRKGDGDSRSQSPAVGASSTNLTSETVEDRGGSSAQTPTSREVDDTTDDDTRDRPARSAAPPRKRLRRSSTHESVDP